MQTRPFGRTGFNISRLGFGAMRLPLREVDGRQEVDDELAIPLIHRAFELGVNYIDTAYGYCHGLSEVTVGRALKGWRDKVWLSTKFPIRDENEYRRVLEHQLTKLDVDYLDGYHFHGIGGWFLTHPRRDELVNAAVQAKDEGLIRHISFSFHDEPEKMADLIDLGIFSSVLCQYNLLNRANEDALANAREKGLGTVVMGPVGGGRIAGFPPEMAARMGLQVKSSAELALRFVFANPHVDCALSGMSTLPMVEENATLAAVAGPLTPAQVEAVNASMAECKRLGDLYCTGCGYCLPECAQEVNIPRIFEAMNWYRIYGLKELAQRHYDSIGTGRVKGFKADACVECGECEPHCPQRLEIRQQLKECLAVFG